MHQSTTTKDPQMERGCSKRETAQSWEMKKVRPMLIRSNLADAKHTREQFICVVENAAKGGFQISGFTSTSDSHASQPPEGAIWVTPTQIKSSREPQLSTRFQLQQVEKEPPHAPTPIQYKRSSKRFHLPGGEISTRKDIRKV